MEDKTKNFIESVDILSPEDVKWTDRLDEEHERFYVLKSDFDRVVEELTKWNKVEDGLPKIGIKVLVRLSTGNLSTSQRYISIGSGVEHWKGSGTFADSIISWKYIN